MELWRGKVCPIESSAIAVLWPGSIFFNEIVRFSLDSKPLILPSMRITTDVIVGCVRSVHEHECESLSL